MRALGRSPGEFAAAGTVIAVGAFLVWKGSTYRFGTAGQIGPGLFPASLGVILCVIGLALLFEPAEPDAGAGTPRLRPILFAIGSVLSFSWVAPRYGLVPATVSLVVLSCLANRPVLKPLYIVILTVFLSVFGYYLFVRGLSVPLTPFG